MKKQAVNLSIEAAGILFLTPGRQWIRATRSPPGQVFPVALSKREKQNILIAPGAKELRLGQRWKFEYHEGKS